nr:PREDICTED: group XV phospholipase A2-like [Bemisia tabaci]
MWLAIAKLIFYFAALGEACPVVRSFILTFTMSVVLSSVDGSTYNDDILAPIILVHGVTESQILGKYHTHGHPKGCEEKSEGPDGWEHMWLNLDMAIWGKHVLSCWAYRFQLLYNRDTHKCSNQNGVETKVRGKLGSLKCCEFLSDAPLPKYLPQSKYFHQFKGFLKHKGYSTDHSLKAHCYDWRYAPPQLEEFGYFNAFTELVEHMAHDTGRKVAIVGHSMGGLVSAYFLMNKTQDWKDRHIHALITAGTPWLGSVESLGQYIVGNNKSVPTINKDVMKRLLSTFQSIAFLLPEENAFKDTVMVEWVAQNKKYTAKEYRQFFIDVGAYDAYLMRQDLRSLYPYRLDKLGVNYHCVWSNSSKIDTPVTYRVHAANLSHAEEYEKLSTEGDKVVPLKSLRYCEKFQGSKFTSKGFQGPTHLKLVQDDDFFNYVMSVVRQVRPFAER